MFSKFVKRNDFKKQVKTNSLYQKLVKLSERELFSYCKSNPDKCIQILCIPKLRNKMSDALQSDIINYEIAIGLYKKGRDFLVQLGGEMLYAICRETKEKNMEVNIAMLADHAVRKQMGSFSRHRIFGFSHKISIALFNKGDDFLAQLDAETLFLICHHTDNINSEIGIHIFTTPLCRKVSFEALRSEAAKALFAKGWNFLLQLSGYTLYAICRSTNHENPEISIEIFKDSLLRNRLSDECQSYVITYEVAMGVLPATLYSRKKFLSQLGERTLFKICIQIAEKNPEVSWHILLSYQLRSKIWSFLEANIIYPMFGATFEKGKDFSLLQLSENTFYALETRKEKGQIYDMIIMVITTSKLYKNNSISEIINGGLQVYSIKPNFFNQYHRCYQIITEKKLQFSELSTLCRILRSFYGYGCKMEYVFQNDYTFLPQKLLHLATHAYAKEHFEKEYRLNGGTYKFGLIIIAIQQLLNAGANLDTSFLNTNKLPGHWFIECILSPDRTATNAIELFRLLLNTGASINLTSYKNEPILNFTDDMDCVSALEILMEYKNKKQNAHIRGATTGLLQDIFPSKGKCIAPDVGSIIAKNLNKRDGVAISLTSKKTYETAQTEAAVLCKDEKIFSYFKM